MSMMANYIKQHSSFLSEPSHVSLLLNTDGVAIFRSSSYSVWPVWIVVNELPKQLRYFEQKTQVYSC